MASAIGTAQIAWEKDGEKPLVELSRRGMVAVLLVSFVAGTLTERWLSLTNPVFQTVAPVVTSAGGPALWMGVGAVVGAFGLLAFRRLREEGPEETVRSRPKRRSGRI
ncbi:MAG: hypothetical protein ACYDDN_10630 [Candidatus Desulforudaceae bacterium]|jgi:hypothetical protein